MLNSKFCEGSPPVLQINDIRYGIFEMVRLVYCYITEITVIDITLAVMQYLYNGSAEELPVQARDILELMAAANFFQVISTSTTISTFTLMFSVGWFVALL